MTRKLPPIHPGEVLLEEFLGPMGISADTALRLARYFGTSDQFWMNLQSRYDLETEKDRLGRRLAAEVRVLGATG